MPLISKMSFLLTAINKDIWGPDLISCTVGGQASSHVLLGENVLPMIDSCKQRYWEAWLHLMYIFKIHTYIKFAF